MTKREIIRIVEEKCNGCGICIPNCPEGALQIIDGKARLVSDLFCDGLGACIGHCPKEAIIIEEREAEEYDERKVMKNIVKQGRNTIQAHLKHLKEHNQTEYLNQAIQFLNENKIENPLEGDEMKDKNFGSCPGTAIKEINKDANTQNSNQASALRQWPVQLALLPTQAPFFENAHLLISADCAPFANANFHQRLLNGKSIVIGCPKLDDIEEYKNKLIEIFRSNRIKSLTVAIMEVPCCYGLYAATEQAIKESGKNIPLVKETISINGEIQ